MQTNLADPSEAVTGRSFYLCLFMQTCTFICDKASLQLPNGFFKNSETDEKVIIKRGGYGAFI